MENFKEIKKCIKKGNLPDNIEKIEDYHGFHFPNMYIWGVNVNTNHGWIKEYNLILFDENMNFFDCIETTNLELNIEKIIKKYILKKFFPKIDKKLTQDLTSIEYNFYSREALKLYSKIDESIDVIWDINPNNRHKGIDTTMRPTFSKKLNKMVYVETYSIPYLKEKKII